MAIGNFEPKFDNEISLSEGMIIELVAGKESQEYWVVREMRPDASYGQEGLVPSTHLELVPQETDDVGKRRMSISFNSHQKDVKAKEKEALNHRE